MGVEIKGQRDGFYIIIDEKVPFVEAREKLLQKLEESNGFFQGARFFRLEAPGLKKVDVRYLQDLLEESYGVRFASGPEDDPNKELSVGERDPVKKISTKTKDIDLPEDISISAQKLNEKLSSFDETINKLQKITEQSKKNTLQTTKADDGNLKTKFVFENMRSGSEVEYDGNVIIFGDVNPGAKVIAKGSIIVMGNFRGMAHAGKGNDEHSFIAALKLLPLQIRIHDVFAVPPQDAKIIENAMVSVENGEIRIEQF
ncbi:MAG: septum site-determining protein MinC [Peptostreptococcaceae bacterium]|nr:septum site-determining protein MinC [Peptostreptococcaceae bacterium]